MPLEGPSLAVLMHAGCESRCRLARRLRCDEADVLEFSEHVVEPGVGMLLYRCLLNPQGRLDSMRLRACIERQVDTLCHVGRQTSCSSEF